MREDARCTVAMPKDVRRTMAGITREGVRRVVVDIMREDTVVVIQRFSLPGIYLKGSIRASWPKEVQRKMAL